MHKVYFAGDHAGFALKKALIEHVRGLGYDVADEGALSLDPNDDYPDYVAPLAKRIVSEPGTRGIVIGGSGEGEAMCANRVPGARAAVCYGVVPATAALEVEGGRSEDAYDIVRLARRHNNANILCLGARFISGEAASEAVRVFLETPFSKGERHERRLAKF